MNATRGGSPTHSAPPVSFGPSLSFSSNRSLLVSPPPPSTQTILSTRFSLECDQRKEQVPVLVRCRNTVLFVYGSGPAASRQAVRAARAD